MSKTNEWVNIDKLFDKLVNKKHYRLEVEFFSGPAEIHEKIKKLDKDLKSGIKETLSDVKIFKEEWIRILSKIISTPADANVYVFFKVEGVSLYAYAKVVRQVLSKHIVDDENKRIFIPLILDGMQFPADESWKKENIHNIKVPDWTTAGVNNVFKEICCGVEND